MGGVGDRAFPPLKWRATIMASLGEYMFTVGFEVNALAGPSKQSLKDTHWKCELQKLWNHYFVSFWSSSFRMWLLELISSFIIKFRTQMTVNKYLGMPPFVIVPSRPGQPHPPKQRDYSRPFAFVLG
jgi:hypothetical protein